MLRHFAAACVALAALTTCASAAVALEADATSRPTLALTDLQPLVVTGKGFRAGERVRLIVSANRVVERTVRASASGQFRVAFRLWIGRCDAVVVQAFGGRGSRAHVDVTQTACAPEP
jgi:hypothetical protein